MGKSVKILKSKKSLKNQEKSKIQNKILRKDKLKNYKIPKFSLDNKNQILQKKIKQQLKNKNLC